MESFISLFEKAPRREPRFQGLGAPEEPPQPPVEAEPVAPLEQVPEPEPDPEPDLEALLAEAEARGRRAAQAELAARERELESQRMALEQVLAGVEQERQQHQHDLTVQVAEIVLLLARRVVGTSLALHPDALRQVVSAAVARFPQGQRLRVRVAPEDLERVAAWLPSAEVVADEGVAGGCVVSSDAGEVDASLDVVCESLEAAVRAWQAEGR